MRGFRILVGALSGGLLLCALLLTLGGAKQVAAGARSLQSEPEGEGQVQRDAVGATVRWLVEMHQNEDGGYTAFSQGAGVGPSDVAGTVDAILALASTGHNVNASYPGLENTPLAYLEENTEAVAAYAQQNGAATGKLILALSAAGRDARTFGGHYLAISLTQHLSPTGQYNVVSPFEQALALMAHSVITDSVPEQAVSWLDAAQASEGELAGSWDDGFGTQGSTDATAMALMALVAVDAVEHAEAIAAARTFLMENQLEEGGWGYAPGLPASANSTALAIQALSALGEDFYSADSPWAAGGVSPLQALLGWQSSSGAFQADFGDGPLDDFFTTIQALPALTGRPYPLPARGEAAQQALACLLQMRDGESGGWPEFAGAGPSAGGTARAIRAIAAAGVDVSGVEAGEGEAPLQALRTLTPAYLEEGRGGRLGAVLLGAASGGADVRNFGGVDLVLRMSDYLSPTGEYDNTAFGPYSHAQAMLGLLSAGAAVDPSAMEWLRQAQGEDGGWGDADATGISLQVLAMASEEGDGEAIDAAIAYLHSTQQSDGGWGFALPSSVNSTSVAAQGLTAAGENPFEPGWSVVVSGTLQNSADLAMAQQGANGCWPNLFGEGDDPYATTDGIILLTLDPAFGSVGQPDVDADPEAAEDEATEEASDPMPEPTPTETLIVEATEVVPSPTAEPDVAVGEATAAATPEATAVAEETTGHDALAEEAAASPGESPNTLWFWIAGAFVLMILVMAYFRYTNRYSDE